MRQIDKKSGQMLSDNQVVMGMDEEFSSPSPATKHNAG